MSAMRSSEQREAEQNDEQKEVTEDKKNGLGTPKITTTDRGPSD